MSIGNNQKSEGGIVAADPWSAIKVKSEKLKIKNDRLKMKNSKSETLNSKQYQNPNDRNRKKEKGFENLNFGNWDLFRI